MNYFVYDEDGKMIRCFQYKREALRFLQDGWTINFVPQTSQYEKAIVIGTALL